MALEDFRLDMERCSQCSYCKFIPLDQIKSRRFSKGCPSIAYNNFNAYSARGRFAVALSLLKKQSEYHASSSRRRFQMRDMRLLRRVG